MWSTFGRSVPDWNRGLTDARGHFFFSVTVSFFLQFMFLKPLTHLLHHLRPPPPCLRGGGGPACAAVIVLLPWWIRVFACPLHFVHLQTWTVLFFGSGWAAVRRLFPRGDAGKDFLFSPRSRSTDAPWLWRLMFLYLIPTDVSSPYNIRLWLTGAIMLMLCSLSWTVLVFSHWFLVGFWFGVSVSGVFGLTGVVRIFFNSRVFMFGCTAACVKTRLI